jgi:hypothetical protein
LGGKGQPGDDEKLRREELLDRVREASLRPDSYDGTSLACARLILEAMERYPVLLAVPHEASCLRDGSGEIVFAPGGGMIPLTRDLYDVLKQLHPEGTDGGAVLQDLTGFMWGWAYNAVQYILGGPSASNPAILEIDLPGSPPES